MMVWKSELISEVLEQIKTGSTPSTLRTEFFGGSIPWFTPADIGATRDLTKSLRYITEAAIGKGKANLFDENMLLLTCIGDIGRVGILKRPASSNQQITALKFCSKIDVSFAYYWFIAHQNKLEQRANQAIVPILNTTRLQEIDFSYPSLQEQKRIVTVLEKADRLRRQGRYALKLSSTYLQSVFLEMFGDLTRNPTKWDLAELDEACKEIYRYPTFYGFPYVEKGIPVVRIGNILSDGFLNPDLSDYVFITPEISKKFPRTILDLHDIVMAVRGDGSTVSRIGMVNSKNLIGANISPNLLLFRAKEGIVNPIYLFHLMVSNAGQRLLEMYITRTAKKTITAQDIKQIRIPIPYYSLQEKFAQIVQKFEHLRAQQREAEQQAEHLFQTLLNQAFEGELALDSVDACPEPGEESFHYPRIAENVSPMAHKMVAEEATQLVLPLD